MPSQKRNGTGEPAERSSYCTLQNKLTKTTIKEHPSNDKTAIKTEQNSSLTFKTHVKKNLKVDLIKSLGLDLVQPHENPKLTDVCCFCVASLCLTFLHSSVSAGGQREVEETQFLLSTRPVLRVRALQRLSKAQLPLVSFTIHEMFSANIAVTQSEGKILWLSHS